jgi:hypothetical protein
MDCIDTAAAEDWADWQATFSHPVGLTLVAPSHPARAYLETFIAEVFAHQYGARISYFAQQLVALQDRAGQWLAAAGYTPAQNGPLFVEHYFDAPVHEVLSERLGVPVARSQLVETGNLASIGAGAGRKVIFRMAAMLHRLERTWVVLTATRQLLNAFQRLEIAPIVLARADPRRLPDGGASWGSYYETHPLVVAANIPLGFLHLRALGTDALR